MKLETILGIPVAVVFRTSPCIWEIEPEKRRRAKVGRKACPAGRFIEHDKDFLEEEYLDAWKVRNQFFGLKSEEQFLSFLNRTGYFSLQVGKGLWGYQEFLQWQSLLREFLKRRPPTWGKWLDGLSHRKELYVTAVRIHVDFKVQFHWKGKQHTALILAKDTLTAMLATVYIDHLRGARFRFCARPDCRKPYEVTTRHKRKYCRMYCGHLESLRRSRARGRKRKRAGA